MASIFNHASMAHNNHFFFSSLSNTSTPIPSALASALESSFGSIETLKREFVATGNAMFGPGYVWLVQIPSEPVNTVGAHGPLSSKTKLAPGGVALNPVLCVSTWQHVYMPDWGVLQKKQFLEAWWDRIDWNVVANNAVALGSSKFATCAMGERSWMHSVAYGQTRRLAYRLYDSVLHKITI